MTRKNIKYLTKLGANNRYRKGREGGIASIKYLKIVSL